LEELALAGVRDRDITIVFALGAHRRHSAQEQIQLVGQDVFRRIECIDSDTEDCIYLGETSRGTPVEIFRRVVEAEFLICIGNIDLHHFAGYSGGAKAILPGVSSLRSITANHVMWFQCNTAGATAGKLEGNPVRGDIEEAGQMVGLGFILNAIVDSGGRILDVVAGDALAAHRQGCACVDARNKIPVSDYADIVVVSPGAYPKDISLFQAQKALDFAVCAVKEGGIIVLLAECREGIGDRIFEAWLRQAECPKGPLRRIREEFVLGGDKAAAVASVVNKTPIYLVSSLPREIVRECWRMPGLHHFGSVDAALEAALARQGQDASITIMPDGNSTLPVLGTNAGFGNSS
jgi:nickel-dependent lactate racemase